MMKKFLIPFMVVFLLLSITVETFSAAFITSSDHISLFEKEETGKEDQKEKEGYKLGEENDKWMPGSDRSVTNIQQSSLWSGYLHPELICRQSAPPEMPPELA
jgi:hypothetical protein